MVSMRRAHWGVAWCVRVGVGRVCVLEWVCKAGPGFQVGVHERVRVRVRVCVCVRVCEYVLVRRACVCVYE